MQFGIISLPVQDLRDRATECTKCLLTLSLCICVYKSSPRVPGRGGVSSDPLPSSASFFDLSLLSAPGGRQTFLLPFLLLL